jgi:hypothetical protein
MANNFQQWQGDWEEKLPDDIEQKVIHQAKTLAHFGRVMELFVPNALQTAAHLIGGSKPSSGPRRAADTRYSDPIIPEGRPRSGGGKDERLLPSDDLVTG